MLSKFRKQLKIKNEIYLKVKVRPGAIKTLTREIMDNGTIKVDVAAPPVKGKANQELVKFLAQEFSVRENNVKLISGIRDKVKFIKIVK